MVGGKAEDFIVAEDLLKNMAKNVVHCGAVGTGQVNFKSRNFLQLID